MATSDLTEILKKPDWRRDEDTERILCELILRQLDDSSGDVSSLAVKWCANAHACWRMFSSHALPVGTMMVKTGHACVCSLGLLVRRVHKDQAERILDFLCTKLLTGKKDQDRENASVALKSVISEISGQEVSGLVIKQVVPKLLQGMQAQADVATACMDIMNSVVGRFGHLLTNEHGPLKAMLLQELATSKAGIRKRALACLGAPLSLAPGRYRILSLEQHLHSRDLPLRHVWTPCASCGGRAGALVPYLSNAQLDEVAEDLCAKLEAAAPSADTRRTCVQGLGVVGCVVTAAGQPGGHCKKSCARH